MSKRSSKQSSSSPVVRFLKEWGLFSIIVGLIIASRIYLWAPVKVDGHSMDPTLADSEYLLVVNHLSIDRFDIVVANEKDDDGKTKDIVKRVIGLPGDTIQYDNDTLYINGKKTNEPYLKDYIARFKKDKLQSTYTGKGFEENGELFRQLANTAQAFTVDKDAILNLPWSCSTMNTSYLEMTGSFQKIAVKSELSRKNKSKDKPSLDYGRSTLSKLISID